MELMEGTMTMVPDKKPDTGALLRLLQLVSPSLPTGGFAYSQGLEWAIETGWIKSGEDLEHWLEEIMIKSMTMVDIPIFSRLFHACCDNNKKAFTQWSSMLLASRETSELRLEEKNRGRALASILKSLGIERLNVPDINAQKVNWNTIISSCQVAGFALAAAEWKIPIQEAAAGYIWAWLENQVLAGIKIIPLGQTRGQQVLQKLSWRIQEALDRGLVLEDEDIGSSLPALAIGSSCHETQYTRLFRS